MSKIFWFLLGCMAATISITPMEGGTIRHKPQRASPEWFRPFRGCSGKVYLY